MLSSELAVVIMVCASAVASAVAGAADAFHPGKVWLDDRGKPIESHLGGILYDRGTYYWYGMNFDGQTIKPGTYPGQYFSWMENRGVSCYSSKDLYHWKFEGVSLLPTRDDPKAPLQPTHLIPRPKVVKCDKTGKYVMMGQLVSIDFKTVNCVVVGTSDTPAGPFAYHGLLNPPGGGYDITVYKDDEGKAYLITSHEWVKANVLSEDYLSIAATHELQGVKGEAPAIFKHDGTYYCLTSHLTGWAPNANKYSVAKAVLGPWEPKGEFCKGPEAANSFRGQTTFVLPVADRPGAFIFMADRMNAKTDALIDDLRAATHIWLPITLDPAAKTLQVQWRDEWDLSVFETGKK
jgi:hypothetical protein